MRLKQLLSEAEYTHIGYGKYKEKGKEKDSNAPMFKKDDNGKFTPISAHAAAAQDADAKKDTPKVNIFNKSKKEPAKKDSSKPNSTWGDKPMKEPKGSDPTWGGKANKNSSWGDEPMKEPDWMKGSDPTWGGKANKNSSWGDEPMKEPDWMKGSDPTWGGKANQNSTWGDEPKAEPKKDEPKAEPKKLRQGNPQVNKATKAKAEKLGITPQKLGKEEYQTKMAQAAVEALTDANFHSEARELIAKLEGKPEMAEKPDYPKMDDPKFKEKMAAIRTKYASKYADNVDSDARELGTTASQESGWGGVEAADSIAFTLRMNGFHKLADTIQSVFDDKPYMKQEGNIRLSKL